MCVCVCVCVYILSQNKHLYLVVSKTQYVSLLVCNGCARL